jgi:hypothetical protein
VVPLLSVKFHFSAPEGAARAPFPGAAWRGAFGYALKRTVCVMRPRVCAGCPFELSCAYPYVFETAPGRQAKVMRDAHATPRPFVLRLPKAVNGEGQGGEFELGMTLLGRAIDYLPFIIHAVADAGQGGIGRARTPYELNRVTDAVGGEIWTAGSNMTLQVAAVPKMRLAGQARIAVELVSPLRLVRNGSPIRPAELDGPTLAFAAVRRVALLRDGFAETAPPVDLNHLRELASHVSILDPHIEWSDHRRFSTRQNQGIVMGGITGGLVLDLTDAPGLSPFLETCEHVHIGKGVTLGHGEIVLTPA